MISKVVWLLTILLLASVHLAEAQQSAKVHKVGWLGSRSASAPTLELFRRELRTLGYTEDRNIAFEYRYAEGKVDRLPALAHELVDSLLLRPPSSVRHLRSTAFGFWRQWQVSSVEAFEVLSCSS